MAVYSLSGFANRIQQALESKSSSFLAADRVLKSAWPIEPSLYADLLPPADPASSDAAMSVQAANFGSSALQTAHLLQFQTMVYAGDAFLLVNVKAVDGPYPLRGDLLIKPLPDAAASVTRGPPEPGTVWLEERLLAALQVQVGEQLEVGSSRLTIAGIVAAQPDASFNVFRAGPVVIMNGADIAATGVVLPGSRLTYKMLFAGNEARFGPAGDLPQTASGPQSGVVGYQGRRFAAGSGTGARREVSAVGQSARRDTGCNRHCRLGKTLYGAALRSGGGVQDAGISTPRHPSYLRLSAGRNYRLGRFAGFAGRLCPAGSRPVAGAGEITCRAASAQPETAC
jgi:hypothetical protein